MQNKEKIIKILTDELHYCYCDNCKFNDYDKYQENYCDGCYRKYSNWALSPKTAEEIIDKIIQSGEVYLVSKEELEGALNKCRMI